MERLWWSLNYEEGYLQASETVGAAREGVARCLTCSSQIRQHRALDGRTPDRVYWENRPARPTTA